MKTSKLPTVFKSVFISLLLSSSSSAAETSAGLSLLPEGNARALALGRAFTAESNDIAALVYNPASIGNLKTGLASLLYRQGLIGDSNGQLLIGLPRNGSGFGLSIGYYNGGKISPLNSSGQTESLTAQQDLNVGVGYARSLGGVRLGVTGKYFSSTLAEDASASAFALDLGAQIPVSQRLTVGAAALNYGTKLKYQSEEENLPRMMRLGASYLLRQGPSPVSLLVDFPYAVEEKELTTSIGLETLFGPLALRAGYRNGADTKELTLGAGFNLQRASVDYAFGLVNQLDAQHNVSLGLKFGGGAKAPELVRRPVYPLEKQAGPVVTRTDKPQAVTAKKAEPAEQKFRLDGEKVLRVAGKSSKGRIYIVRPGDTLAWIAKKELGNANLWRTLYAANKHLLSNPYQIEKGMQLIIP